MAYIKQEWNSYNEALTIEQNVQRHAVAIPQFMEHIEDGIVELDRKSFDKVNVEIVKDAEASGEVIDGTLNLTIPESQGEKGDAGLDGFDGKSAYEIAVENGYTGTEIEWLTSLKGEKGDPGENGANGNDGINGKSAYELAVEGGFEGDEASWLASLKGEKGDPGENGVDGKSAYQIAVDNGFEGTEEEWINRLSSNGTGSGTPGINGKDGADGKSAYQVAVDNGYTGTEIEWLASLKGEKGDKGDPGLDGADGEKGSNGADGKSAYSVAVDNGYTGTVEEWLTSLKGDKGDAGENGVSIGVATTDPVIDAGTNTGTIAKEFVSPALNVGEHFISSSGSIYSIDEVTDDNYVVSSTNINLVQSAEGTKGNDGFNIGIAVVEPIDGEISIQQVNSVTKVGDHFIAPSGEIFMITEVREDSYMSETTGVTIKGAGAGVDFKGEAIGHCSNLEVTVVNDNTENPQLQVTYTDPISEGIPYGGTIVAVKENELPATPEDADFTKDTMDKDAHKTEPVVFEIPRSDALQRTFFATLFPYSSNGVYNLLKKERKEFIMNWVEGILEAAYSLVNIPHVVSNIIYTNNGSDNRFLVVTANPDNSYYYLNQLDINNNFEITKKLRISSRSGYSWPMVSDTPNKRVKMYTRTIQSKNYLCMIFNKKIVEYDVEHIFSYLDNYVDDDTVNEFQYGNLKIANSSVTSADMYDCNVRNKYFGIVKIKKSSSNVIQINNDCVEQPYSKDSNIDEEHESFYLNSDGSLATILECKELPDDSHTYIVILSNGKVIKLSVTTTSTSDMATPSYEYNNITISSLLQSHNMNAVCVSNDIKTIWHVSLDISDSNMTINKYTVEYDESGNATGTSISVSTINIEVQESDLLNKEMVLSDANGKLHIIIRDKTATETAYNYFVD